MIFSRSSSASPFPEPWTITPILSESGCTFTPRVPFAIAFRKRMRSAGAFESSSPVHTAAHPHVDLPAGVGECPSPVHHAGVVDHRDVAGLPRDLIRQPVAHVAYLPDHLARNLRA